MMPLIARSLLTLVATATLTLDASAAFTASGTFLYVDRVFTFNGFSGVEPALPIRLATVQVINDASGQVLATGATAEDGTFSIPVGGAGTANVVVRCFSRSNQFGTASLRATNGSAIEYSVSSAVFPGWNLSTNLAVGTITAQKVLSGSNQGGPFNMLDMLIHAVQYAKAQGASNPSQSIRVEWPGGSGSFASGNVANMGDDDGFDDLVQLHEIGHVLHYVYSESDNTGGTHTFGQSDQDPRLSFGEGWASFFAGAVRERLGISDPGFYLDCDGQGQTGSGSVQLRMRHEDATPYGASTAGEADEGAVFCALWELVDDAATNDGGVTDDDPLNGTLAFTGGADGHKMSWSVFVGPIDSAVNCTIRDFWNGQFTPVNHGNHAQLATSYTAWEMRFTADVTEPNNSIATATPLALGTSWSPIRSLYHSPGFLPAPGDGDQDFYSFALTQGSTFEVETRYPNAVSDAETYADTHLQVFRPNGTLFSQSDAGGAGRNAKLAGQVADASGIWTARVATIHSYRKTGSYQVRAQLLSGPAGGCASPVAIATTFGVSKPGIAGAPILSASPPVVGGAPFTLTAAPVPPSFAGFLVCGVTATALPFDGGFLYVSPLFTIPLSTSPAGALQIVTPLANPAVCGATIHLQAMFPGDPGALGGLHTSQTNRLTLTFGG